MKLRHRQIVIFRVYVAPRTGAWIETRQGQSKER